MEGFLARGGSFPGGKRRLRRELLNCLNIVTTQRFGICKFELWFSEVFSYKYLSRMLSMGKDNWLMRGDFHYHKFKKKCYYHHYHSIKFTDQDRFCDYKWVKLTNQYID